MTFERRNDNREWPQWLQAAWQGGRDAPGTLQQANTRGVLPDQIEIVTLEGNHLVTWGDWLIRGICGELYPCKPEIFEATYEPVNED